MIDMKKAFEIAKNEIVKIYDDVAEDIRLEEVNLAPNKNNWELTISFLLPSRIDEYEIGLQALLALPKRKFERVYKKIILQKEDGQITSLKIYKDE
ncbi:MAG: hypothetical protein A2Y62_04525 [Candidatus Fischerbacteria bacterium RBG_13_37_8]|uniref:Uncharacterized protein n=1 Tax=Candidatus Fischerbacteria bacterium RBG_13_37_8 TaxID=1817863 RepID=A0A1F5V674_9BACT|nr:MAG: hypothetical protein A2Y62_04525 [Candidatus Fischerbacteria bacterium RBG_13_37_8]